MTTISQTITKSQLKDTPSPIFQQLLAHELVSWIPAFDTWIVTRCADVIAMLRDAETFAMAPEQPRANPIDLIEEQQGQLFDFEFKWKSGTIKRATRREFQAAYPNLQLTTISQDNFVDFLSETISKK